MKNKRNICDKWEFWGKKEGADSQFYSSEPDISYMIRAVVITVQKTDVVIYK
jgi:hypothetical protein